MSRKSAITLTVVASILSMLVVSVEAQRGRRRGRRGSQATAAARTAPNSAAIAESLGDLRWGMEPRAVHEHFSGVIRERYREQLTKATDAITEDRIRRTQTEAIQRLRQSYVRFTGERTGWDLSFLQSEFTHGNNESMLVYRDGNSQNFYFFINGRLWKWYKAFDASVFQGQGFAQFASAVQSRFGEAVERNGRLVEDGPQQRWLEWQDNTTRLRAVDQTRFYGFYCLVFEDRATVARLSELRTNTIASSNTGEHALVESVLLPEDGSSSASDDSNSDIIDRITGNIRRRPAQGEGGANAAERGGAASQQRNADESSRRSSSSRGRSSSGGGGLDLSDL